MITQRSRWMRLDTATPLIALLALACGDPPSGNVSDVPGDPAVDGSTFDPLPGDSSGKTTPSELGPENCTEVSQPRIIIWGGVDDTGNPSSVGSNINRLNTGNAFVAQWTVCNIGRFPQNPGGSYVLDTIVQTIDETMPPWDPDATTEASYPNPAAHPTIPIPALAKCTCYDQMVGINRDVPAEALAQPEIQGLSYSFPRIDLPPNQTGADYLQQYLLRLPDSFGVGELVFNIL